MVAILAVLALSRELDRAKYEPCSSIREALLMPISTYCILSIIKLRCCTNVFRCANLEALAALDEGVGDPEEPVVTEIQHAQELQVLKLASREDGGEVVPQLVVTVGQGE